MKISLNTETGKIEFFLWQGEEYYIEEHLDVLVEFVAEQAV